MSDKKKRMSKSIWARIRRQKSKLVIKKRANKNKKEAAERLDGLIQQTPKEIRNLYDKS